MKTNIKKYTGRNTADFTNTFFREEELVALKNGFGPNIAEGNVLRAD